MKLLQMAAVAFMLAAAIPAADKKDDARFSPGPASSYSSKQTNNKITVAAKAYDTEELARQAFGKLNPNQYGVLPILVIIQNDTPQALKLDHLQVEYLALNRESIENTPADDVQYLGSTPKAPRAPTGPIPPGVFKKKNPLNSAEITTRAFGARMLPPNESASGFFYFQTSHSPGSKLYVTGITVAATGAGILYYEIPLDQ